MKIKAFVTEFISDTNVAQCVLFVIRELVFHQVRKRRGTEGTTEEGGSSPAGCAT